MSGSLTAKYSTMFSLLLQTSWAGSVQVVLEFLCWIWGWSKQWDRSKTGRFALKPKQWAEKHLNAPQSWGELKTWVMIICEFVNANKTFHITCGHLIHCMKILIIADLKRCIHSVHYKKVGFYWQVILELVTMTIQDSGLCNIMSGALAVGALGALRPIGAVAC